jgi:hypothetical protein
MSKGRAYPVLSAIRMNKRTYQAGETIDLDERQFEALRASGAIGLEPAGSADVKTSSSTTEQAARAEPFRREQRSAVASRRSPADRRNATAP